MSVSAGDRFLVTFRGRAFGQDVLNTFWYGVSAVSGTPSEIAFSNAMHSQIILGGGMKDTFLDLMPTQYVLQQIWIQKVDPLRNVAAKYNEANTGTFAEDASTANLAGVITRRGGLAKRTNLSSLHLMYPNLDAGILSGSVSVAWNTAATAFLPFLTTSILVGALGTVIPVIRNGPGTTQVSPIESAFVQTTIRVMRRRTLLVGK